MNGDEGRVPDLLLEQYALGELYGADKARVDAILAVDPGLRGRLEELRRSDEAILAEYPPAEIAAAVRRRMLSSGAAAPRGAAGRRFLPARAFAFPAAAAVLVLVGAVAARGLLFPPRGELVLAKGGAPSLFVYKKAAAGPVELADGAPAAAGDLLQIKYAAGSARFGAIVSLDGRGRLTWHLPAEGALPAGRAPRIEERGAALASAYELDDAPSFERFFLLASKEDFDLSLVSSALRELARSGEPDKARLTLPAGLEYKSLLLRKAGGAR
jgi:hypothetical protein